MKEHGNSVKVENKYYTCFTSFSAFSSDIIYFHNVLHFDVGRSEFEWKLKVKTNISVFP